MIFVVNFDSKCSQYIICWLYAIYNCRLKQISPGIQLIICLLKLYCIILLYYGTVLQYCIIVLYYSTVLQYCIMYCIIVLYYTTVLYYCIIVLNYSTVLQYCIIVLYLYCICIVFVLYLYYICTIFVLYLYPLVVKIQTI